jgi:valyl-tRNA synthetase
VPLRQDNDVLETWFSSALWTFGTLGWPDDTQDLADFHPTDVLVTGHDIIFFWVARMIMMTLRFTGEVPFRKVYIHGLVRDAEGNKMSKTRGNGLDPLDLIDGISLEALLDKRTNNLTQPQMKPRIEKATRRDFPDGIPSYGTDALRFTFCALASTGRDIRFDLQRVEGYRNFCNKLWNASRFVLMNAGDEALDGPVELSLPDRWIRSRARELLLATEQALATYRFDLYATALYDFVWHDYCDWYLELTKPVLWSTDSDPAIVRGTRRTLVEILEMLLRAAHPVIPFITDALWREVAPRAGKAGPSVMLAPFPVADDLPADTAADTAIDWLKGVILALRNIRGEAGIKPGQAITVLLQGGQAQARELAGATESLLKRLARVDRLEWLADDATPPAHALSLVGDLRVMVPLAGLIDLDGERARLGKEIARREQDVERLQQKLANPGFADKAPAEVVARERQKLAEAEQALATLRGQIEVISQA